MAMWPGWSRRFHFRARIAAPNTTRASLAISEGWIVTGPKVSHRVAPPTVPPPEEEEVRASARAGWSTATSSTAAPATSRRERPRHARYGMAAVTTSATRPTTTYITCRLKNQKLEPKSW
jgi:hypothetical protein